MSHTWRRVKSILGHRWRGGRDPFPRRRYAAWIEWTEGQARAEQGELRARVASLESPPVFAAALLVPPGEGEQGSASVRSLYAQSYPHWRLLICDLGGGTESLSTHPADERLEKRTLAGETELGSAVGRLLADSSADYLLLLRAGDQLAPAALERVTAKLTETQGIELLYSDEDLIDERGRRSSPRFKPDWSPDLLLSHDYIGGLAVLGRDLVARCGGLPSAGWSSISYALLLRASRRLERARVVHLPEVLYHRSQPGAATSAQEPAEIGKALRLTLEGQSPAVTIEPGLVPGAWHVVWPLPEPPPRVSIIVPTRNRLDLLRPCVESILSRTDYPDFELALVDNGSDEPEALEYLQGLRHHPMARVLDYPQPFNFSGLNNFAAATCRSEILAFVNNDVEVLGRGWLRELAGQAVRPEIGAAGARLLYPDGRVQHGGILLGGGSRQEPVAAHLFWGLQGDDPGYLGRAQMVQNVSAVTGACLVLRRKVFEEIGGFDAENLPVAFNDVDLCLKVTGAGYRVVWTPHAELLHHESPSRGDDLAGANRRRFRAEVRYMRRRWGARLEGDPYYNPNLDPLRADFALAWPPRHRPPEGSSR